MTFHRHDVILDDVDDDDVKHNDANIDNDADSNTISSRNIPEGK